MQNLVKAKLPTPREDGKPGAHAIRKNRYYLDDDRNLTPSEAAKSKKSIASKPVYILAMSREEAIKKLICFLKDDRRLTGPLTMKKAKLKNTKQLNKSKHKRVSALMEEDSNGCVNHELDVLARRSVSPLSSPLTLDTVVTDSWKLTLQGIFLEMIRIFWLVSRRRQLREVTLDANVENVAATHPIKELGFLLTSASSAIDVVLSPDTDPKPNDIFTTLSYLTPDHKKRVDYHLILNDRGVKAMERFVDHFSRPSDMKEETFDLLNVRLIVSSSRNFFIEPYLRLKSISYLS